MNTFKSIDELLRVLEREKLLLKQMFQKRPSASLKYDYALELTEYKEERYTSSISRKFPLSLIIP